MGDARSSLAWSEGESTGGTPQDRMDARALREVLEFHDAFGMMPKEFGIIEGDLERRSCIVMQMATGHRLELRSGSVQPSDDGAQPARTWKVDERAKRWMAGRQQQQAASRWMSWLPWCIGIALLLASAADDPRMLMTAVWSGCLSFAALRIHSASTGTINVEETFRETLRSQLNGDPEAQTEDGSDYSAAMVIAAIAATVIGIRAAGSTSEADPGGMMIMLAAHLLSVNLLLSLAGRTMWLRGEARRAALKLARGRWQENDQSTSRRDSSS